MTDPSPSLFGPSGAPDLKRALAAVRAAAERLVDVARETPCVYSYTVSEATGRDVWLKLENLQRTGSFKVRGAMNKVLSLDAEVRARGLVAASAGNHAQGVALAARKLGVKALIVMPRTTPSIKVESVRDYGVRIKLTGDTYDDAYTWAAAHAEERGMTFIHPYDDPEVIAGQGTVALEILRQHEDDIEAIFVPVGGGGLISGIALYIPKRK